MLVLEGKWLNVDRAPCFNPTITATLELMEAVGVSWAEVHHNPELMAKLASAGRKVAGFDCATLPFDFVVEAEVLGAKVDFMEEVARRGTIAWPTVKDFTVRRASDFKPPERVEEEGRIPLILKAIRILKREFEGETPVNVVMNPPFTCVAYYLTGPAEFMRLMMVSPEEAREILDASLEAFIRIAEAYEGAGADILTLHDMGASSAMISPQHFKAFALPYLKRLAKAVGCKVILSICGPNLGIVEGMMEVGDAIALDERTPIGEARRIVDGRRKGYPIAGNLSPKLLARGGRGEIFEEVKKVLAEGVDIVAPGCDLLPQTPTRSLKAMVEASEKFGRRSFYRV